MPRQVVLPGGAIAFVPTEEEIAERESKMTADQLYKELDLASAPLELVKERKIRQLDEACNKAIIAGFQSESTGHFFRFNLEDQTNFNQMLSLLLYDTTMETVMWKTEDAGVVQLTREQFLQVVLEAKTHKETNIQKYWNLKAQVQSKMKNSTVDAINWE